MNCWPVAVKRFNEFQDMIAQDEVSHLRDCFLDLYRDKIKKEFL